MVDEEQALRQYAEIRRRHQHNRWTCTCDFCEEGRYRVTEATQRMAELICSDQTMSQSEVKDYWTDEFLTNIIVPHLAHMQEYWASNEVYQSAHSKIKRAVLEAAIEICKEWRG